MGLELVSHQPRSWLTPTMGLGGMTSQLERRPVADCADSWEPEGGTRQISE